MRIFLPFLVLVAALSLPGCPSNPRNAKAPLSTMTLQQTIASGSRPTVVFFLNPQGGPCQTQNGILEQLHKDRNGSFNVAYVSTLKPEDQQAFYDYGVRNLPSLVLVDKSGSISQVFPPGIQSYEALSASLDLLR